MFWGPEVRTSTYKFWGNTIESTAITKILPMFKFSGISGAFGRVDLFLQLELLSFARLLWLIFLETSFIDFNEILSLVHEIALLDCKLLRVQELGLSYLFLLTWSPAQDLLLSGCWTHWPNSWLLFSASSLCQYVSDSLLFSQTCGWT